MRALLDEIDHYLSALRGPGISEVRQGIARRRQAQFQIEAPRANAVVDRAIIGDDGAVGAGRQVYRTVVPGSYRRRTVDVPASAAPVAQSPRSAA